ncbi:MAG: right-handed parallel beta-helix repeat-containing protein, partial [Lentisphaerae bacterium]|nr:right-handed parallel beta-helix repeat-containing protein [Lentisphaerota bacterium]
LGEYTAGTDPQNADSDADTMPDGWEVANGLDPLSDDTLADPDADGLNNLAEYNAGTDPQDADSDDDGLSDGFEVTTNGVDNLYVTDPLDADSDDDTLSDGAEVNTHGTNPLSSDTDSDGMPDGWEVSYGLDPNVDDAAGHADSDGLTNLQEYNLGSKPNDADSDDDGFEDQDEAAFGTDPLNDTDPLFVDDDHAADPQPYDPLVSNSSEDGSLGAPFDSIQEAIDAAVDGSTVLVTNGYYIGSGNRNIDPLGKAISIITFSSNPADTLIDADGLGSAFLFQKGEDTNTVIRGFEIISPPGGCADGECGYEYGIVCIDGSSPLIQDCYIHECEMAGIYCSHVSSPRIENVIIKDCGVGIEADSGSSLTVVNCLVSGISGTGILVSDAEELSVSDTTIIDCVGRGVEVVNVLDCYFTNCVVTDNLGGFRFEASRPLIESSQIIGNVAPEYYMYEGAVRATNTLMAVVADADPDYSDVTSDDENGGGILLLDGSELSLINCVLAENLAVALDPGFDPSDASSLPNFGLGGALYVGNGCRSFSINCTFAGNEARRGAAISSDGTDANYIRNAILWGNVAEDQWISGGALSTAAQNQYASLECRAGSFDIWYSDVEYGDSYINPCKYVIEADPLFVLGGYELSAGSPCIDVGTSNEAPATDVVGIERPQDGNLDTVPMVDLGAYEFEP